MQADWAWGEPPSLVWQRTREQAGGPKSNASSPNIRRGPKLGGQVPQRPTIDPTHAGPPSARRLWSVAPVLPKLVCIGPPGGGGGGSKWATLGRLKRPQNDQKRCRIPWGMPHPHSQGHAQWAHALPIAVKVQRECFGRWAAHLGPSAAPVGLSGAGLPPPDPVQGSVLPDTRNSAVSQVKGPEAQFQRPCPRGGPTTGDTGRSGSPVI